MYKQNDLVVYNKDVCRIVEIKTSPRNNLEYFFLKPIIDSDLTIQIPTNKSCLFRSLATIDEINNLIKKIPEIKPLDLKDRNIEVEYKNLLARGTHEDLIKIIKTTYLRNEERINNHKKLGDKDKSYFEIAEKYLYNEIASVLNLTYDEAKLYVIENIGV